MVKFVWGDQLMIVLSRDLLRENKGAKIIGDVKCSQIMFDDIREHGGIPVMWKTGHSLIKQKMREEGALLARRVQRAYIHRGQIFWL